MEVGHPFHPALRLSREERPSDVKDKGFGSVNLLAVLRERSAWFVAAIGCVFSCQLSLPPVTRVDTREERGAKARQEKTRSMTAD